MNKPIDPYIALLMLITIGLVGGIGTALLIGAHS